jgi:hypothetical protein
MKCFAGLAARLRASSSSVRARSRVRRLLRAPQWVEPLEARQLLTVVPAGQDAYVRDGTYAANNFGAAHELQTNKSGGACHVAVTGTKIIL